MIGGLLFVLSLSVAPRAVADVAVYLAPQLGISVMTGETTGNVPALPTTFGFKGDDQDASPLVGVAVGLEMPMDEIVPREWLSDIRLPRWPVRFEFEYSDLREYELRTNGAAAGAADYFTEFKARTFFANSWADLPFTTVWRPVQFVFGLGRQPGWRRFLEPGAFYFGAGVGFTEYEFNGSDNTFSGDDETLDFAWNVGAGMNYAISERVKVSAGYRYVSLGADNDYRVDLTGGVGLNDSLDYTLEVHEFRVGIQIDLFSFRGVWR